MRSQLQNVWEKTWNRFVLKPYEVWIWYIWSNLEIVLYKHCNRRWSLAAWPTCLKEVPGMLIFHQDSYLINFLPTPLRFHFNHSLRRLGKIAFRTSLPSISGQQVGVSVSTKRKLCGTKKTRSWPTCREVFAASQLADHLLNKLPNSELLTRVVLFWENAAIFPLTLLYRQKTPLTPLFFRLITAFVANFDRR